MEEGGTFCGFLVASSPDHLRKGSCTLTVNWSHHPVGAHPGVKHGRVVTHLFSESLLF